MSQISEIFIQKCQIRTAHKQNSGRARPGRTWALIIMSYKKENPYIIPKPYFTQNIKRLALSAPYN